MEFEEKLRLLIKSKYSKLVDLAEKFDMNYTQLSQYMNGRKVSIEFLTKIIQEFPDVDLNWLLREDIIVGDKLEESPLSYKKIWNNEQNEQIINKIEELLNDLKIQLKEKN